MPSDFIPGAPGWFDVISPDVPATAEFYCGLFGWTAQDTGPERDHYTLLLQQGAHVAGIAAAVTVEGDLKPAIWVPYFASADCKETVDTAVEAGGAVIIGPTNTGGTAAFAILIDPDGAPYGVSQPITDPGTERFRTLNNPCWVQYAAASKPVDAMAHYVQVFGWHIADADWDSDPEGPGQLLSVSGVGQFGAAALAGPGSAPFWSVAIHVADTDATVSRALELGGTVVQKPRDTQESARMGVLCDPAGASFVIMSFPD